MRPAGSRFLRQAWHIGTGPEAGSHQTAAGPRQPAAAFRQGRSAPSWPGAHRIRCGYPSPLWEPAHGDPASSARRPDQQRRCSTKDILGKGLPHGPRQVDKATGLPSGTPSKRRDAGPDPSSAVKKGSPARGCPPTPQRLVEVQQPLKASVPPARSGFRTAGLWGYDRPAGLWGYDRPTPQPVST